MAFANGASHVLSSWGPHVRKLKVTTKNQGAPAERNTAAGEVKCHPPFGSDLPCGLPAFEPSDVLLAQTPTMLPGRFALDTTMNAKPHVKAGIDPKSWLPKAHCAGVRLLD